MVNQQIYLPMIPDSAPIVVNISQNDFDAAGYAGRLFFNLINNGVAYDMDGATAIFQGEKPDGTSFAYPATVVNDSVVRVNVRQQMTVVSGRVVCQLVLNNTDGQIGSFNIWLEVQPSGAAGGDPSQTDIPALIAQAHEYADQAEQSAINAAAWSANPPYIGANGNWFVYDADTEAYVDTGVYASGTEGSLWYTGTAVNGKDVNPRVFPTGITTAREHDMYLNKTEGAIYQCTLGGPDSTAKWAYVMTLSGGGGGASDYPDLGMKPEINGHTLQGGNQTGASLGLQNTLVTGDGIDITGSTISAKLSAGTNVSLATQPDGTIEISAAGGGGGMLPYLYIDSEASATVTVNQPDGTVITPTAAGSGHWECELTGGYGTYVIHSVLAGQGDATQSLVVDTVMEYHVTDTHYDHTVSFVAPSGSTVRIEGGTEIYTLTGTGSTQTQAVHSASTSFTVTATMDGNGKPYTFTTPSTTGQTTTIPSGTFDFGTINVSVAADFVTAGSTITCAKTGISTISKTATSTLTFRVPETGTYTISGTVSGTPYSVDAEVTSLSVPVSRSLDTMPNGATVLPTDDIEIWLKCAGITDKAYTTLAQVLADTDTLVALCADSNACDYMARSTNWASGVTADSTAMQIVGKYGYCANALRNDNTWNTAINNSPYASYVPVSPVVPTGTVIHSAVEDVTYYVSGGSNVPFCTIASGDTETVPSSVINSLKGQTVTIGSSVAKDPDSLTDDYTKSVRITPNVTEIYLMPDNALYWWGYIDKECEELSTANGWSSSGATFSSPTYSKNNAVLSASTTTYVGIGSKLSNAITSAHSIIESTNLDNNVGLRTAILTSKAMESGTSTDYAHQVTAQTVANTIQKIDVTYTASYCCAVAWQNSRAGKLYALWYE